MTDDNIETIRTKLKTLDMKRQSLESESEAIINELNSKPSSGGGKPMGVDTPLVDRDGYPRNDIDVYRARELRNRLSVIRTDHKGLMMEIERRLIDLSSVSSMLNVNVKEKEDSEKKARMAPKPKPKYDPVSGKWVVMNWDGTVSGVENGDQRNFHDLSAPPSSSPSALTTTTAPITTDSLSNTTQQMHQLNLNSSSSLSSSKPEEHIPFAIVDSVSPTSPAETAGLKVNDLIVRFDKADHLNNDNLRLIAELVPEVAASKRQIVVVVLRKEGEGSNNDLGDYGDDENWRCLRIMLSPRPWSGRGLLGCHIQPFTRGDFRR